MAICIGNVMSHWLHFN